MNAKQRIISLKLVEAKKNYSEFLDEIGVAAGMKENNGSREIQEKKVTLRRKNNYGKLHS